MANVNKHTRYHYTNRNVVEFDWQCNGEREKATSYKKKSFPDVSKSVQS
jgi:hypothetical protein